jgi:hypothetical protein
MSATYNWKYKAGSVLKFGAQDSLTVTIAASADNVKPANAVYVGLFGNDTSGNGSRQYPYRTFAKGCSSVTAANQIIVLGSGVYRENYTGNNSSCLIIGDGNVVVDGTGLTTVTAGYFYWENVTIRNFQSFGNWAGLKNSTIMDFSSGGDIGSAYMTGSKLIRIGTNGGTTTLLFPRPASINVFYNNTFIDCMGLAVIGTSIKYTHWKLIFHRCNIVFNQVSNLTYCLFYNCNFRFSASYGTNVPSAVYPAVPASYANISTLPGLIAAQAAVFPGALINFDNCQVTDPLFNNPAIDDYTLQFGSPARNMSYQGTYVGAHSIAYPVKASATESTGSFDFSTAVNFVIANDSLTLANTALDAEIKTKLIVNPTGRQIQRFPIFGFNADRNGQYIDSIADLDTISKSPGNTLSAPVPYLVENGAITYNNVIYQPGDKFTTVTGITSFTSSSGGTVREIIEAPQRHTMMMRCSNGNGTITAGSALGIDYWYFVQSGSVVYNTVTYNAGSTFKAVDTNAFTGTGAVTLALSTETFQHYEPGIQPTSNNAGDSATGAILRGNGDPSYIRGGYGVQEFPVNAVFIQLYYQVKVNNLKP